MTVAQFIFKHFCRIRRSGLKPTSWALLLWLSDRGECWSTRQQIVQALAWLKGGNGMHITIIRDLVERKLVERSNLGGRGEGRAAYRITPAGIAFLKLPVAEATHNAH